MEASTGGGRDGRDVMAFFFPPPKLKKAKHDRDFYRILELSRMNRMRILWKLPSCFIRKLDVRLKNY
jgi:hypothetical protein